MLSRNRQAPRRVESVVRRFKGGVALAVLLAVPSQLFAQSRVQDLSRSTFEELMNLTITTATLTAGAMSWSRHGSACGVMRGARSS